MGDNLDKLFFTKYPLHPRRKKISSIIEPQ